MLEYGVSYIYLDCVTTKIKFLNWIEFVYFTFHSQTALLKIHNISWTSELSVKFIIFDLWTVALVKGL